MVGVDDFAGHLVCCSDDVDAGPEYFVVAKSPGRPPLQLDDGSFSQS